VIKKLHKRIKKYLSSPQHVRSVSLVILLIIILAIPLTVVVVQSQQDIRQRAAANSTFRSVDTNKCGSIISQPAAGVTSGTIVWKAPRKLATGWETQKPDGTIFTQAQMKDAYVGEPRNGESIGEDGRAQVWDTTVVSETHINCNTFINITLDGDCTVEFVEGIGSTDKPVAPEGTVSLQFTVDTNRTGGFCRKLINVETAAGGITPTVTPSVTAFPTNTPTPTGPTPTGATTTPTNTPTRTPTPTPTTSLTPTPTLPSTPTFISVSMTLPGIGTKGNASPNNMQRRVFVQLFDAANKTVGVSVAAQVSFDPSSGIFKGTANFGTVVPTGNYSAKLKTDQYLVKKTPAGVVTAGTSNTLVPVTLISGDINGDNKLDILDYNILVSCFGSKINSDACGGKKVDADLNDDGVIDGVDYNLFIGGIKTAKQGE